MKQGQLQEVKESEIQNLKVQLWVTLRDMALRLVYIVG